MKRLVTIITAALCCLACTQTPQEQQDLPESAFVRVDGPYLIEPSGDTLFIKGTNLGNWLNPEGYMFGFQKTNSAGMINQMFCELVGPDFTAEFWKLFKDNYVTEKDIEFIASTGPTTSPYGYSPPLDSPVIGGEQPSRRRRI